MDPGGDFPSTGYINPKLELRVRMPHMHILPVKILQSPFYWPPTKMSYLQVMHMLNWAERRDCPPLSTRLPVVSPLEKKKLRKFFYRKSKEFSQFFSDDRESSTKWGTIPPVSSNLTILI